MTSKPAVLSVHNAGRSLLAVQRIRALVAELLPSG
jgi:hypothetical protein